MCIRDRFTLDSAELKKVWFSNLDQSIGSCCVDLRGDPGGSCLNDPVVLVIEPLKEAAEMFSTVDLFPPVIDRMVDGVKSVVFFVKVFFLAIIRPL